MLWINVEVMLRLPKARWLIGLAVLLVLSGVVVWRLVFSQSPIGVAEGTLTLQPGERILVLAPHPDDEVLGCGGLIQAALEQGSEVWVAWMTCGDGPWLAADEVNKKLRPRPQDYLSLGRRRQEEARAAAKTLGVPEDHLFFFGYPDQGLAPLWQEYWERPFRSPHTHAAAVPYGGSPHPYTGQQVLADLLDLLRALQPTRVFTAHPNDAHPDHWATVAFLLTAREVWTLTQEAPFPEVYACLVHRWEWPRPTGYHPTLPLEPPAVLSQERHEWLTFPLTEPQILGKRRALEAHHSQIRISRAYLRSFVRSNELFEPLIFPVNRFSSHLWREGERVLPEEVSPNAPMITFLPGAEIKALEIRADEQGWYLRVLLRSHPLSHLTYRLFLHGLGQEGETVVHRKVLLQLPTASASNATLRAITPLPSPAASGPIVSSQRIPGGWEVRIPRDGLAPSQVLLYGAEVRWHRRTLDRTSLSCWNGPESDATPVPAEQEGEHP